MAQHSQAAMTTSRKNPGIIEGYNKNTAYVAQQLWISIQNNWASIPQYVPEIILFYRDSSLNSTPKNAPVI